MDDINERDPLGRKEDTLPADFKEFFRLGGVNLAGIPIAELNDDSLSGLVELEPGQTARFVIEEAPIRGTKYEIPRDLILFEGEIHHLRLNLWVHETGNETHTYPQQSRLFNGLVAEDGRIIKILSEQIQDWGLITIRRSEELSSQNAETLIDTAIKLKRFLLAKTPRE